MSDKKEKETRRTVCFFVSPNLGGRGHGLRTSGHDASSIQERWERKKLDARRFFSLLFGEERPSR